VIDEILADEGNLETLRRALQERFNADPVRFWLRIAAPLLPRPAKLELELLRDQNTPPPGLYAAVLAALNPELAPASHGNPISIP